MSDEETHMIGGEVRRKMGELPAAVEQLWEEYHEGYSDPIAVDRAVLTKAFPHLVPEGLSARVKYVPLTRDVLWRNLTGKNRKKESWNT